LNEVGGRPSAGPWRRFKKLWGQLLGEQLLAAQARGDLPNRQVDFVAAGALLVFANDRPRDEGNFRSTLEKALGDALVGDRAAWPEGRWLADDTQAHFQVQGLAMVVDRERGPLTIVELEWSMGKLL
jgi:hypothetical protein